MGAERSDQGYVMRVGAVGRILGILASFGFGAVCAEAKSCALDPVSDGPWFPSVVAFEHFDSGRTHAFRCAEFTGTIAGRNAVSAEKAASGYLTPYNLVIGEGGARFIYGGAYGDFPGAPGSFVAKLGDDGSEIWRRQLFDAPKNADRWNYPGVIGGSPRWFPLRCVCRRIRENRSVDRRCRRRRQTAGDCVAGERRL